MTQCEKVLRYLVKHPKGMTMRDGYLMYINSPHKRVSELEALGVKILHTPEKTEHGARIVRYVLADKDQDRVKELMEFYGAPPVRA